jgi:hypothetical protein
MITVELENLKWHYTSANYSTSLVEIPLGQTIMATTGVEIRALALFWCQLW